MADSEQDKLAQVCSITGCTLNQASFFLDSAGGDVQTAVAHFFDNPQGNDDAPARAPAPAAAPAPAQRGTYTLSGAPAQPLPAGWGGAASSSASTSRSATPSNPLRSNTAPRVTGFRDLASASSAAPGSFGAGDDDDDDDDDDSRDPATFFTGGAKSGLSVENPDDRKRTGGGMADMVRDILNKAREGGSRRLGGEDAQAAQASGSRFFGGNAHTLGSDEQPSTYIPDPHARTADEGQDDVEDEEEVAVRHLTFWQDGFSIEDGDLMSYDEHRELLAAIQSGRAPLSLLKVRHDQPVELRIAERRGEKWVRQPPPPQGPFAGSGNRLGSVSPYPSSSAAPTPAPAAQPAARVQQVDEVVFEVDRTQPTTQIQIRLRNGDRMVATFNQTHTVGDIRRYINASRPGEASAPYVLQTTFPTRDLVDDKVTVKEAGLMGSVVVQRPA